MSVVLVDRSAMADFAQAAATSAEVCVRPHVRMVIDRATGERQMVPIPCGSTRETKCPSCATKARRLRMHQCREGWHREDEPELVDGDEPEASESVEAVPAACEVASVAPGEAGIASLSRTVMEEARAFAEVQGVGLALAVEVALMPGVDADPFVTEDGAEGEGEGAGVSVRRVRSTRRIDGFPDLPRVPVAAMEDRTVGGAFTDEKTGKRFRPSMFITLTLPSYGRVYEGVPVDPERYDYRRAALDALTFSQLVDRFWQNLRRCAGYQVQYFSAIEAQRRLAPHLHAAVRGAIPRATVKAVVAGTYFAAWWPSVDEVFYDQDVPVWDAGIAGYVDPMTGALLPTWGEATAYLEEPVHVASFGRQVDVKGLLAGTEDSDRTVRYLCKYLTKSVSDTFTPEDPRRVVAYEQHVRRLHAETLLLPCSPSCANWLRFGVTPKNPTAGMIPGRCSSAAHDRENLGIGGRRVLVSRQWSGKTLTEHKADCASVVREVLDAAGIEAPDADRLAATQVMPDGTPRFEWRDPDPVLLDYTAVIGASMRQAITWRRQYDLAKQRTQAGTDPPGYGPVDNFSAIDEGGGQSGR